MPAHKPRMALPRKPAGVFLLIVIALLAWWLDRQGPSVPAPSTPTPSGSTPGLGQEGASGTAAIEAAFRQKRSGVWVTGAGEIVHLLPDDRNPPRHQLLLVALPGGHTIKIAHNVDLAPRVPALKGAQIRFRGRFEYNEKGGVVHWTHRDPNGGKPDGWLEYAGTTYR